MKCLIKCRFEGRTQLYDYYAEGSPNELAGNGFAIVDSPYNGRVIVLVADIRPLSEQVYDGKLKPVEGLFTTKAIASASLKEGKK